MTFIFVKAERGGSLEENSKLLNMRVLEKFYLTARQNCLCVLLNILNFIVYILTLKAPITTAADYSHNYFFIVFQRK